MKILRWKDGWLIVTRKRGCWYFGLYKLAATWDQLKWYFEESPILKLFKEDEK